MAQEGSREREATKNSLKSAGIVLAALAFGWMAVELAFKPFLDSGRKAIDRANPDHDPDDDEDDDRQNQRPSPKATSPSEES